VKPVPGEPGTYGTAGHGCTCVVPSPREQRIGNLPPCGNDHRSVDAGLAPHSAFPVKPVPGEPGTYGTAVARTAASCHPRANNASQPASLRQ